MVMRHIIILLALLCASCNASLPSIKPYKMDIQQGNVVTSKMMLQLKPGMTKSQVRFIMGTPLIQDGFHPDRWDYFYQMRKAGKIIEQRRVIMEFENDALKRVRGDVIPAGRDPAVPESQPSETQTKKSEDKGLLDRLMFWKDDEEINTPQAAPEELVKPDGEQKSSPAPVKAPESKSEPAPAEEPQPAAQEAPAKRQPSQPEAERAPAIVPEPEAEPPAAAPAEVAPAPAQDSGPAPAAAPPPAAEPVPAETQPQPVKPQAEPKQPVEPTPEDDLPPEGAPGYFERMLEKIGF